MARVDLDKYELEIIDLALYGFLYRMENADPILKRTLAIKRARTSDLIDKFNGLVDVERKN